MRWQGGRGVALAQHGMAWPDKALHGMAQERSPHRPAGILPQRETLGGALFWGGYYRWRACVALGNVM